MVVDSKHQTLMQLRHSKKLGGKKNIRWFSTPLSKSPVMALNNGSTKRIYSLKRSFKRVTFMICYISFLVLSDDEHSLKPMIQ